MSELIFMLQESLLIILCSVDKKIQLNNSRDELFARISEQWNGVELLFQHWQLYIPHRLFRYASTENYIMKQLNFHTLNVPLWINCNWGSSTRNSSTVLWEHTFTKLINWMYLRKCIVVQFLYIFIFIIIIWYNVEF